MIGRICTGLLLMFFLHGAIGYGGTDDVQSRQQELEALRREIARTRQRLEEKRKKEQNLLDVLSGLDREIDLTHQLVRSLQAQSDRKKQQIQSTRRDIRKIEKRLARLRDTYRKRIVNYYKRGRVSDLELLLRDISLHRAQVWLKFERLLAERDRRTYERILDGKKQLERRKQLLELQLQEHERLLQEKNREEKTLQKRRAERQKLLQQVQRDRQVYEQRLREIEEAAAEIRRLISRGERQRARSGATLPEDRDFAVYKGRLPWPVKGKVLLHFGRYEHPQFKTVTENLGVDIRAPLGTPVKAVFDGRVTAITWQRGRGNIVILSHPGGYYTVYTHLAEIHVGLDEDVTGGQVIGTVGDTGSLNGPKLHFQIWHNTQNLDPEQWLGS